MPADANMARKRAIARALLPPAKRLTLCSAVQRHQYTVGVAARRAFHRIQQPVAEVAHLGKVALMLGINQPEAVAIGRDVRKGLHQLTGVNLRLKHWRAEDRDAV